MITPAIDTTTVAIPGGSAVKAASRGAKAAVVSNGGDDVLRHYTTGKAAKAITKEWFCEPVAGSGRIWLTSDRCSSGARR